ncbi:hypothetical protein SLS58_011177 [Diplodia intermedia]|uniref:Uncharacterized protein n=1 Tax=Diplodia intermedia TaxID=856260 RepID=A0ABR3T1C0_9PEZI
MHNPHGLDDDTILGSRDDDDDVDPNGERYSAAADSAAQRQVDSDEAVSYLHLGLGRRHLLVVRQTGAPHEWTSCASTKATSNAVKILICPIDVPR